MKTFSTEYTAKNLTKNAGLVNLGKFADKRKKDQAPGSSHCTKRAENASAEN